MRTIALLGAGTIGRSWATRFLAHGYRVRVFDPRPGTEPEVRQFVHENTANVVGGGTHDALSFERSIAAAVEGCAFIQESGPEDAAVKTRVIAEAAAAAPPDTVIASSTTALTVSQFAGECDRVVVAHPFNPVHLMPLVEVGGGDGTAPWAVDAAVALYESLGMTPVRLQSELVGHIANRLQAAVFREACYLVAEGKASVEDVDTAMTAGPGLRWGLMGPFRTMHLGGGDRGGLRRYFDILGESQARRWADLAPPGFALTEGVRAALADGVERAAGGRGVPALAAERDRKLRRVLEALSDEEEGGDGARPPPPR